MFEYNIIDSMLIQLSYEGKTNKQANNNLKFKFNNGKIHSGEGYSHVIYSKNENKINK